MAARFVKACPKDRNDAEDVIDKLPCWRLCVGRPRTRWFHGETRPTLLEDVLEEFVDKSTQSVAVGQIHRAYSAAKDSSQKGLQTRAAEVEATTDVVVDVCLGVLGLHVLDPYFSLAGGVAGLDRLGQMC